MKYAKSRQKTNYFQLAVLLAGCFGLSACADATWPNGLTGEPDPAAIGQNRVGIERVDQRQAVWPNLATVPGRPSDMPSYAARRRQIEALTRDHVEAMQILEDQKPKPAAP